MQILALDSSQLQACVCLIENGKVIAETTGSTKLSHSQSLLNYIDQTLRGRKITEIDVFAVGIGPGSFTGIRIGVATQKAFAQALQKPMIVFSSLRALADQSGKVVVKAYQDLVFVGRFDSNSNQWVEETVHHEKFMSRAEYEAFQYEFINTKGIATAVNEKIKLNEFKKYTDVHARYLRPSAAEIKWEQMQSE